MSKLQTYNYICICLKDIYVRDTFIDVCAITKISKPAIWQIWQAIKYKFTNTT